MTMQRFAPSSSRLLRASVHMRVPRARGSICRAATLQAALPRALAEAHDKAVELFKAIEERDLLTPGRAESEINEEIFELCASHFGTRKHWHKRLVRVGANTIHPIYVDTPDLTLQADDIAFIDLGPVFDDIEADFARTYVIGDDPEKHKLAAALPVIFDACKAAYSAAPDMTGAEFYSTVCRICLEHGYQYGNNYCAHLIDAFAHKTKFGMDDINFARPENSLAMSAPAPNGDARFWVLEIHILQDPAIGKYAGFYEDPLQF